MRRFNTWGLLALTGAAAAANAACALSRLDGMLVIARSLRLGASPAIGAHAQRGCGFSEFRTGVCE